jgi:hypothetical protein
MCRFSDTDVYLFGARQIPGISAFRIWFAEVLLIDKLTLLEVLPARFFAIACSRARPLPSVRLRRSRWQYMATIVVMLALCIQSTFRPLLELTVGLFFLVLLTFPITGALEARK